MSRILECTPAEHLFFTQHLFLSLLGEHLYSASRAEPHSNFLLHPSLKCLASIRMRRMDMFAHGGSVVIKNGQVVIGKLSDTNFNLQWEKERR